MTPSRPTDLAARLVERVALAEEVAERQVAEPAAAMAITIRIIAMNAIRIIAMVASAEVAAAAAGGGRGRPLAAPHGRAPDGRRGAMTVVVGGIHSVFCFCLFFCHRVVTLLSIESYVTKKRAAASQQ